MSIDKIWLVTKVLKAIEKLNQIFMNRTIRKQ